MMIRLKNLFLIVCFILWSSAQEGPSNATDTDHGNAIGPDDSTTPVPESAPDPTHPENGHGKTTALPNNQVIENILTSGYNKNERPNGPNATDEDGGPVVVRVNFALRRLSNIDEENMDFQAEITFRQEWIDPRLHYGLKYLEDDDDPEPYITFRHDEAAEKIWTPDTFFLNAIETSEHEFIEPSETVRIYPNGKVIFSKRHSLTLSQPMDFGDFPFDEHDLHLDISSYSYTEDDIIYAWRDQYPIQYKKSIIHDPHWELETIKTKACKVASDAGVKYSCIRAEFEIDRQAESMHMFQIFGPSFILVLLSWFPFMISSHSLLFRVLIGISCLITIILQIALIEEDLPDTHEMTWAHKWLITCFAFIVAAQFQLVAFAWVKRFRANRAGQKRAAEGHSRTPVSAVEGRTNEHAAPLLHGKGETAEEQLALMSFETIFDLICLLLFALAFFIFNCYFWTVARQAAADDEDTDDEYDHLRYH